MKPRLESSLHWTALPTEQLDQISDVVRRHFVHELKECKLFVEGRIYPCEFLLRIGFLPEKQISQQNFEISIEYNPQKDKFIDCLHLCIDAAGYMMAQYFTGFRDFPHRWKEIEFEDKSLYFQHSTVNTELEKEADKILGLQEDKLYNDSFESEDALDKAIIIDDEDKAPKDPSSVH